jgi:hypothetical protein
MRGVGGSVGQMRGFVLPLLALVLFFRLLIPSGYMISADGHGSPGLALCAASARAAAPASHDGHHSDPAPGKSGERSCPYAALAAPPLPPAPPTLPKRALAAAVPPVLPALADLPSPAPAAPPPPATGPPLSA